MESGVFQTKGAEITAQPENKQMELNLECEG